MAFGSNTKQSGEIVSRVARLVCLTGSQCGIEYELAKEILVLGRSADCDIVVDDQFASRRHAEILHNQDSYQIHDLQSKNGIVIDGHRLSSGGSAWLQDGSEIQVASTLYRFLDPAVTVTAPSLIALRERGLRVDITTRQVFVDGELLDPPLSAKQFDLLWFLYQNRNRVVSKDEISEAVWANELGDVSDANIDRMVSRIRSRIEPYNNEEPRFIATIRGYGYQLLLK
ncbi:MAG: winged helix-turn-helix domain-containing protein [Caldilineaceae bacterium]